MPTSLRPIPTATQRFYNPDWLDDDDLVAGFVARRSLFDSLRNELARAPRQGSVQHVLIVGPRGTGKTTLLKRLAVAIRRDADLADHLIAISFQEELYQLKNLADFWWVACEALCDELDRAGRSTEADRLSQTVEQARTAGPQTEPYDNAGLNLLLKTCETLGRRPVLLVDNIDMVLQRIDTKGRKRNDPLSPAYWALREALSTASAPIMIGGSVRVSEPFVGYDKAFYDFFASRRMPKLTLPEVEEVLGHLAKVHGASDWEQRVHARRGRIHALHEMTGGNLRALGLIFDLLRQGSSGRAIDDFEHLMDITTPYYKARIEDLSEQAQVIMHALALLRRRVTAAEIARQAGLETRTVSAQLDILVNEGVVEKTPGKKTRYIIAEQLFRIWLQMRTSRRLRQRVMYLTEFLKALFDREEVDAFLAAEGGRAGWLRDYALAEWQGDTPLARALKARACDNLLNSPDGPPAAYAPGDFSADHEALAGCRATLNKHRGELGALDHDQLLGSMSMTVQERCDSVTRLCDPDTTVAELNRLQAVLAEERDLLEQNGLSEADIKLLYDLRCIDQLRLPDLSVDDVEAIAKVYPKWRVGLYRLAWKLLGMRAIKVLSADEAQRWLAFGRANLPEADSSAWLAVSQLFFPGKFFEAATEAVKEALRHGESAQVLYQYGVLLTYHHKRIEEAEAAFRKAIDLEPKYAQAWAGLGWLMANDLGQFEESEEAFRRAIDLDPTNPWSYYGLGRLLANHLRRFEEAEVAFREAVDLNPTNAWSWYGLGELLAEGLAQPEEAETVFRKAIDLDPTNTWSWSGLGELLAKSFGRFEEAEAALRKAIEIDPTNPWSWNRLGMLLTDHLGRFEEAEAALQKAAELEPNESWLSAKWNQIRHRRLLALVVDAVAAENWGIVRKHLQQWISEPQAGLEIWVSDAFIDDVVGAAVRLGRGEPLLRLMREIGLERVALPLLLAAEAALAGNAEGLVDVEPEARATAENLYSRLTTPSPK
jgi:tetratricopeptide (TPR) repeat protein